MQNNRMENGDQEINTVEQQTAAFLQYQGSMLIAVTSRQASLCPGENPATHLHQNGVCWEKTQDSSPEARQKTQGSTIIISIPLNRMYY